MPRSPFRARQSGMSILSLLAAVAVLGLVFTFAIRLVPVYIQHFNVVSSLKNVAEEAKNGGSTAKADIRNAMLRQFSVNDIDLGREVIAVNTTKDRRTEVVVDYEVRKPFVGNIDLVVHFHNSVVF
ncbi:MAG: DUF4845 domain-containing protein [Gammaproteobacteria bacterium]|nr:DUF4845 domain-containing protein [Gammaproteobacteria bacterium]